MTNKTTKSALLTSSISLLLCFAMLLGTTFAWFTDSATSAGNKIMAGNLNVELYLKDSSGNYQNISTNKEPIFGSYDSTEAQDVNIDTLWEPGKTQVAYLKIANEGNLALKYEVALNTINPTNSKDLYKAMRYQIVPDAKELDDVKHVVWNTTDARTPILGTEIVSANNVPMNPNDEHYFALLIHMDEDAGNEYMNGKVEFDITVLATQLDAELDSFGNTYDQNSPYPATGSVTVPEGNTNDLVISAGKMTVTVPADAANEGDNFEVVVINNGNTTDSATGETAISFDLTLYKNGAKVTDDGTLYEVTWDVGPGLYISEVTHNGTALNNSYSKQANTYYYDFATGELTFYTKSYSTFEVTYNTYKEYVKGKNFFYGGYISTSTGADFWPVVSVNPEITKYSVFDGDERITDAVSFRFSNVAKTTINENSYKVSLKLEVKDADGNDLEIKGGMPFPINEKEYLHVYMNLNEVPAGYSVSKVIVDGTELTQSTGSNPGTGKYMLGSEAKDLYFQSKTAGLIEVILTK